MDIKKKYFDLIKEKIEEVYKCQSDKMSEVAALFGSCMENEGVVQLFGVAHGEEFVNELNYRAGGIAPFHALRLKDLVLNGMLKQEVIDSGEIYQDDRAIELFEKLYDLDDRDLLCLVSFYGKEPLVLALAKKAKEKGQKVVAVVNKKSYDACGGTLLDYADTYLDMGAEEPDTALMINGLRVGQISSTVSNVTAQMLTAELYRYFTQKGKEAPVLLSANVKGAD
ncbi:MAG: sugar isomerase domain-containing protein, partial [Erysipelotrichaceae bacterium]|nr:sugar isomerase domain-containing protein [Erysipelotrichaceae bacterium]